MFKRFLQGHGRKEKVILQALIASVVITGGFAFWRQVGTTLEFLELYSRDWMFRFKHNPSPDSRFLVVGITEQDIQTYGYPIPDSTIADLLTTLNQANPATIGLDIIRDVPLGGDQANQDQLIQVIQQQPNTFVVCRVGTEVDLGYPPPPGVAASQLGVSNLPVDTGGIIRRGLLGLVPPPLPDRDPDNPCQNPNAPLFSLGFQTAQQYLANADISANITAQEEIQFGDVVIPPLAPTSGGYLQADTGGYQVLLQFPLGAQGPQQVTLTEVLNQEVDQEVLQDRIILIGYVAESVKDIYSTPFNSRRQNTLPMPGVVIHAQIASQIIGHATGEQPLNWYLPNGAEILWIWIWGFLGGLIAAFIRNPVAITASTLALLGLCGGITFISFTMGGWVLLATPVLAYGLTLTGVSLLDRYAQPVSQQIKEFLKIDIEIDHEKVNAEVEKIEGSEAFESIRQTGQRLRAKRHNNDHTPEAPEPTKRPAPELNPSQSETQESLNSSLNLPGAGISTSTSQESSTPDGTSTNSGDLNNYFDQLRQRGSKMKRENHSHQEENADSDPE